MKRMLLLTIAALSLSGCNLPDLDLDGASYTPRNSAAAAAAPQDQKPASRYDTGQAAENTGDYSNYR
jgi:hypothetical protein